MKLTHFITILVSIYGTSSISLDLPNIRGWAAEFSQRLGLGHRHDATQEIDHDLQGLLEEFKKSADKIFAETFARTKGVYKQNDEVPTHRHRRSINDRDGDGVRDEFQDISHLTSVTPITSLDVTSSIDIETFVSNNELYFVATNGSTNDTQNEVKIYSWDDTAATNLTLLQTLDTDGVYDTEPININGAIYLAVAESNSGSERFPGTNIYSFSRFSRQFVKKQRLWTSGARTVTSMEIEGSPGLVIGAALSVTGSDGSSQEMSAAYIWLGGHFDQFTTFATHGVKDIHAFTIHGRQFLAVANYEDNTGNVEVYSEILIYDGHLHSLESYQSILTNGAKDWEYFGFGTSRHREHFLAVANNPDSDAEHESKIYKYFDGKFVSFQCIYAVGAEQWHAITDADDELVLLALTSVNGVQFYEYDGWLFTPTEVQSSDHSLGVPSFGFTSVLWDGDYIIGIADESSTAYNIFEVGFTHYSPLKDLHDEVSRVCETSRIRMANLTTQQNVMHSDSNNLVYINSETPQTITGNIELVTNVTVQDAVIKKVQAVSGMVLDDVGLEHLADIRSHYANNTRDLNNLDDRWNRTLKISGDQTVTGRKEFTSITVTDLLTADSLTVESGFISGNISLHDLDNNTARTDRVQTFTAPITFADLVTIKGNLYVSGELDDGIDTSDLVTLSGDHVITTEKQFQQGVNISGNLNVDGTIDGINISNSTILLSYGDQAVTGDLTFLEDVTYQDDVTISGLVDGIDLVQLEDTAVVQSGAQTITGDKTFNGEVTMDLGMVLNNDYLIDNVDIVELNRSAIRITAEQEITGTLNFTQDLIINGDLEIVGTINGLSIPDDIVTIDEDPVTLTGTLEFSNDVTFTDLICNDEIDGVDCQGGAGLDILLIYGAQNTSGHYTFVDDIWLDDASRVTGIVDGVDVPALADDAVYDTGNQNISGTKTFSGSIIFEDNVNVDNQIQSVNLTELDQRAIKLSDALVQAINPLIFSGPVTFEQAVTTNGYHDFGNLILSNLVTKGSTENIRGIKTFTSDVVSDDDFSVTGLLNDVDLTDFYRDVINTTDASSRELTGNFTFLDSMTVKVNFNMAELVDGVNLTDIVKTTGAQVISGETTFSDDLLVETLNVDGTTSIAELLEDLTLTQIENDTLFKTGDQHVRGTKTFQEGLTFADDLTLDGLIDGVDITQMSDDAVYKTGNHEITEDKTFSALTTFNEVNVTGTVCGVNINSLYNRSVQQNFDQIITGIYTFVSDVEMEGNLTVSGNISGYQVEYEVDHMVLTTDEVVDVEIYFANVTSEGAVDVLGTIDSIDVGAEAILVDVPGQVITGKKTFVELVTLSSDLNPATVAGVNISDLSASTVYLTGNQDITAHKLFEGEIVLQQNMHASGLVDGVNLTHMDIYVMRTEDGSRLEQRVQAESSIENVHVHDVVYYNGTLDGVDLVSLNETYLSLTRDQTISAAKTFEGTFQISSSGSLAATDGVDINMENVSFINGINLEQFSSDILMKGLDEQTVAGVKTFTSNLTIQGNIDVANLLDTIAISTNMMRTDLASTVTGNKTFIGDRMVVEENINMGDGILVDSVDLSEWKKYAATTVDDFVLNSSVSIQEIDLQQNLMVDGLIDNVNLKLGGVLATFSNQTVTGHKTFTTDVDMQADINLTGDISGVDMQELLSDTLRMSGNQMITGIYTLIEKTSFVNITTYALVNNVSITDLYRQIYTYPSFDVLNASLSQNDKLLDDMVDTQENVAEIFKHMDSLQEIMTIGHGQWHGFQHGGAHYLMEAKRTSDQTGCLDSRIYMWNVTEQQYEIESTLQPTMVAAVETFEMNGRLFMVIGSETDAITCFNGWDLSGDPDGLVAHSDATLPSPYASAALTTVLVKNVSSSDWYVFQHLPCILPTDVEEFVNPLTGDQCIAITNLRDVSYNSLLDVYIYCGNATVGFSFWKAIPSLGGVRVKHFLVNNELYLAVANQIDSTTFSGSISSTIWKLVTGTGDFEQVDSVLTHAASDVLISELEGRTFVIFANEFKGAFYAPILNIPVEIYEFLQDGSSQLEWIQEIPAYGATALAQFNVLDLHYLLVLDDQGAAINVYRYNGIQLFEKVFSVPVTGAESLEVLTITEELIDRIHIAVMSYDQIPIAFPGQPTGPREIAAKILEADKEGERLSASDALNSI